MKKAFLMGVVMLALGSAAFAQDVGVIVGMRADSAEAKTSGLSVGGKTNFQAGGVAKFELKDALQLRTGFIYTQRNYELKSGTTALGDGKFTYFEVPVGLMYKFSDFGGAFIGPALAFNVSKECPGGTCEEVSSAPMALQFGASFKFAPQFGAEFYYETLMAKVAKEIESPKAVVVNLMVTFD